MTEQRDSSVAPTTVLDRVRPTVVRRRVYETSELLRPESAPPPGPAPSAPSLEELELPPPPSSVDVVRTHRALELEREETAEREGEPAAANGCPREELATAPESKQRRTLVVGRSIQVAELARRMSVALEELVEALVRRGFFSATAKTALRRESVRNVAEAFGWRIEGPPADVLLEHMSCAAR